MITQRTKRLDTITNDTLPHVMITRRTKHLDSSTDNSPPCVIISTEKSNIIYDATSTSCQQLGATCKITDKKVT